jgi:hypothetical protein
LQVLHIIETKVGDCKQYQECVTEVFTSLLVVFAIYTRFMNETRTCKLHPSLHICNCGLSEIQSLSFVMQYAEAIKNLRQPTPG